MDNLGSPYIDIIQELVNIGIGRGANVLNVMVKNHVHINLMHFEILSLEDVLEKMISSHNGNAASAVSLRFEGIFSGNAKMIFPAEDAQRLVYHFAIENTLDLEGYEEIRLTTLNEIGNVVINSVIGTFANLLNIPLKYSVPEYLESNWRNILETDEFPKNTKVLFIQTRFGLESKEIIGDFIIFFEVSSFDMLISTIDKFLAKQNLC